MYIVSQSLRKARNYSLTILLLLSCNTKYSFKITDTNKQNQFGNSFVLKSNEEYSITKLTTVLKEKDTFILDGATFQENTVYLFDETNIVLIKTFKEGNLTNQYIDFHNTKFEFEEYNLDVKIDTIEKIIYNNSVYYRIYAFQNSEDQIWSKNKYYNIIVIKVTREAIEAINIYQINWSGQDYFMDVDKDSSLDFAEINNNSIDYDIYMKYKNYSNLIYDDLFQFKFKSFISPNCYLKNKHDSVLYFNFHLRHDSLDLLETNY